MKAGDIVVTAGQNRLSNGAVVTIDNTIEPTGADAGGDAAMSPSDIFIRRPVLSTVLGLMILLLGFQGLFNLTVRQYPEVEETVVTITTAYPGASADLIQGFVTSPIAAAVATTENIDYVTSQSRPSASVVTVQMQLGSDPDAALTEVMSKVQQVRSQLPEDAEDPTIVKGTGQQFAIMYLAMQNPNMTAEQLTEYIERVIRPRLSTVEGVAEVQVLGAASYSMRIWIDPIRLAARGITASEVLSSLRSANFLSAPGKTKNEYVTYSVTMQSTLQTPESFGALPLKSGDGSVVRLRDVAEVELAAENTDTVVKFNGDPGTFIGIFPTPSANPLDTADAVIAELPAIQASLPEGMTITLVYDSTEMISASIEEVFKTIGEAVAIVVVIILLFLGSFRSVMMPVVTIPLSLVGVCFILFAMGYSINLLTLLAMVLRDRPGGRRRHRCGREHPAPYRGGLVAHAGGVPRHARDLRPRCRHDDHARRGLCAARLHRRPDRFALPRVRADACRGRRDFRLRRGHDHADDGGARAEGRRAWPFPAHRRPHVRPCRGRLREAGVRFAEIPAGHDHDRRRRWSP